MQEIWGKGCGIYCLQTRGGRDLSAHLHKRRGKHETHQVCQKSSCGSAKTCCRKTSAIGAEAILTATPGQLQREKLLTYQGRGSESLSCRVYEWTIWNCLEAKLEEEDPLPVAKATFDRNPKNRASRPSGPSEPSSGRSTSPLTQSAKQFADTFSKAKVEAKVEANVANRNPKPAKARFQETIRMMPTSAWSKLYARFPTQPKTPKVETVAAGVGAIAPPESVLVQTKALHSIVPAQWSSFHRHWTCQKKVAEMAIPAILLPNSDAVVTVASASLVKIAKTAVCKEISTVLSSVSPAMWSPLHRKWCGNEGLKSSKVAVAGAMQKLVVAKDYGLLPGLASSMLNAALNIEVKVQQVQPIEDLKARWKNLKSFLLVITELGLFLFRLLTFLLIPPFLQEVSKSVIVKCSVTPAVYSKWHRHWTGGKARWARPEPCYVDTNFDQKLLAWRGLMKLLWVC